MPIPDLLAPTTYDVGDLVLTEAGEYGVMCYLTMRVWPKFESMRPRVERMLGAALAQKAAGWPQFHGPDYCPRQLLDDGTVEPEHYEYIATGIRLATDAPARAWSFRDELGLLDFEPLPRA